MNRKGLALVESIVTAPLIATVTGLSIFGSLGLIWWLWLDHCVYEGILCLSQRTPNAICRLRLYRDAEVVIPRNYLKEVSLGENPHQFFGRVQLQFFNRQISISKEIDKGKILLQILAPRKVTL